MMPSIGISPRSRWIWLLNGGRGHRGTVCRAAGSWISSCCPRHEDGGSTSGRALRPRSARRVGHRSGHVARGCRTSINRPGSCPGARGRRCAGPRAEGCGCRRLVTQVRAREITSHPETRATWALRCEVDDHEQRNRGLDTCVDDPRAAGEADDCRFYTGEPLDRSGSRAASGTQGTQRYGKVIAR
jgi:hypothetical protein